MWSSFTITSPDSPAVVRERLAAALMPPPGKLPGPTTFCGVVWDGGFRMIRERARMEGGMPVVATGRFAPAGDGTAVEVATRPLWVMVFLVCAFSAFWVGLLWRRLVSDPLPGGVHWGEVGLLVGFVAFAWVMLFIACTIEERACQQALTRIVAPAERGRT